MHIWDWKKKWLSIWSWNEWSKNAMHSALKHTDTQWCTHAYL